MTMSLFFLLLSTSLLPVLVSSAIWQDNLQPKIRITQLPAEDIQVFGGNDSHVDHFKLLAQDGESLLIGARNVVYNISLATLQENRRLEWYSSGEDVRTCRIKGKSEEDCHNYIRVLAKKADNTILVCGTNSFKPKCRDYMSIPRGIADYDIIQEVPAEGLCPYDPHHNSTAVYASGNLFAGTVAQFSGADPLIYRSSGGGFHHHLRTDQYNPKHLNQPNFVSSLATEDYVYFFFRETAVEYINCGKRVFSRVGRVCKKDPGGIPKTSFTTFVKARLNCSIPGDFPFYFDEIQSTTSFTSGTYSGKSQKLIYGVFTTPVNSLGASAVCAFSMDDIKAAFDGQFKGQEDSNSNWLPVANSKVPDPRPGRCSENSSTLAESTLNFIKDHPLMDQAVPAFWGQPIILQSSFKFRFTQIAVDSQVETVSGKAYDVLFIGTDDGRVLKVINAGSAASTGHPHYNKVVPVIIEEVSVFPSKVAITNLLVYHTFYEAKLLVVSTAEIQAIPLHKCQERASTCGSCVRLQDPYCAWDLQRQVCSSSRSRFWSRENFVQNVEDGWDPRCPDGRPNPNPLSSPPEPVKPGSGSTDMRDVNRNDNEIMPKEDATVQGVVPAPGQHYYSAETFALSVVTSIVTSFVIGFILGYIFSKRCRKDFHHHHRHSALGFNPYTDATGYTDYQLHHPVHHSEHQYATLGLGSGGLSPGGGPGMVGGPEGPRILVGRDTGTLISSHHTSSTNKPINLVLNVPPANKNGKTANSSADNKPMQQKVKKIYL